MTLHHPVIVMRCVCVHVSCVAGGWSLAQYRQWVAAYLRQLWMSEDPALPPLALKNAAILLEPDPALGLTVFTGAATSIGGMMHPMPNFIMHVMNPQTTKCTIWRRV